MPDLTSIKPAQQNFSNVSGGGFVEVVPQTQPPQQCPVIVNQRQGGVDLRQGEGDLHQGGGVIKRAKSFSRPRSISPNPLRPVSPGRPVVGRPVSLEQRDKMNQPRPGTQV